MKFAKFLRKPFLQNTSGRLFLAFLEYCTQPALYNFSCIISKLETSINIVTYHWQLNSLIYNDRFFSGQSQGAKIVKIFWPLSSAHYGICRGCYMYGLSRNLVIFTWTVQNIPPIIKAMKQNMSYKEDVKTRPEMKST